MGTGKRAAARRWRGGAGGDSHLCGHAVSAQHDGGLPAAAGLGPAGGGAPGPAALRPGGCPGRIVRGGHLSAGDGLSGPAPVPGGGGGADGAAGLLAEQKAAAPGADFPGPGLRLWGRGAGGGAAGGTEAGPGGRRAVLRDGSEDRTAVGGRLLWPADPGVSGDRAARRPLRGADPGAPDPGGSGRWSSPAWWIRATHSPIRPPAGLCWWRRRTAWRSCFHRGSGPVRQSCGTRRGCWSGWRTDLGGCGSACCPTGQWGWSGGLLLALRMDRVQVGEEDRGPMLAALSPTPVSDGGAYRVLVGAE